MPPGANIVEKAVQPSTFLNQPLIGILLLIISVWFLSALDASGKWVMAAGVPLLIFCWFRYLIHFILLFCLASPARGLQIFKSRTPRMQILRAGSMLMATLCFFTTLTYMHQAEATAIIFIAPLLMLTVAPWLLKEKTRRSRWIAAAVGFVGVLLVIRPGAGLHPIGVLAGLATAVLFATQHLATRLVARDDALTTSLWSSGLGALTLSFAMPFVLPAAWPVLSQIGWLNWLVMLSTGISGGMGHFLQSIAYRKAPASLLAPFIYFQLTGAVTIGWLVWGHFPDPVTWTGILILISSGVFNSFYEWRTSRQARF